MPVLEKGSTTKKKKKIQKLTSNAIFETAVTITIIVFCQRFKHFTSVLTGCTLLLSYVQLLGLHFFPVLHPAQLNQPGDTELGVAGQGAFRFIQRDIQLQMTKAVFCFFFAFVFTGVSMLQKCLHRPFMREQACCAPVGSVQTKHLYSQYRKRSDINSIWVSVLEVNNARRVSPRC